MNNETIHWKRTGAIAAAALVVGLLIGNFSNGANPPVPPVPSAAVEPGAQAEVWTCSMHPQIRMPGPGKCPICAMDLIPVVASATAEELGPRQLRLSAAARQLANVQTALVERRAVEREIRMVGKIVFDETRLRYITAWVPGRIDRLFVDYTGISVREGDHMARLYSPELLTTQKELLQARAAVARMRDNGSASVRDNTNQALEATREKLRLWGLKTAQIEQIERAQQPSDLLTIYAPAGGVVVDKMVSEGDYVETGTRLYTIADLTQVWLELEAYESDLQWIHYGQEVAFSAESYPGQHFKGRIAFIDPVLDEATRTIKVRVNVANSDKRLKPGMFARATARVRASADGKILDPALAGKWISPMHPEIVKDGPGLCDLCGMALVPATSLGYLKSAQDLVQEPLIIPASAVLMTGKRGVVYVAVPDQEGLFEGREIEVGARAGDYYLVRAGLAEGEIVVVNGNFKIDSALQIMAKPSMMSPQGGGSTPAHPAVDAHAGHAHDAAQSHADANARMGAADIAVPAAFTSQLAPAFAAYLSIQQALSRDDLAHAQTDAAALSYALAAVDMSLLRDPAHAIWMRNLKALTSASKQMSAGGDIAAARRAFADLSLALIEVAATFGTAADFPIYQIHCPMAFAGQGAIWLQRAEQTENPYFGQRMLRCGTREATFTATAAH